MQYRAALDFLLSRTDYERWPGYAYAGRFDLRRMEELLGYLGNPHHAARSVHIAGSKGKGSTAAMIASALNVSGQRTGLFTSPHLHSLRERIQVCGQPIGEGELATLVETLAPAVETVDAQANYGQITTFELLTVLAFLCFRERGVDYQVLEAGLGGRLDATNVVRAEVCVITSISLDHTAVLGDTLAQIAREKAGIIKPGNTVVVSPQPAEAAGALEAACREREGTLITVGRDVTFEALGGDLSGQTLAVKGLRDTYRLTIPLLGDHQQENAAAAVAALEVLGIGKEDIERGLAAVHWPGRLEILDQEPLLVVDGAHNADSARRLREAIAGYFHFQRLFLIIGVSADKHIGDIVAQLAPIADEVIATRSRHPRSVPAEAVAAEFRARGATAWPVPGVARALAAAREQAGPEDLILATGSLFVVGEVIEEVQGLEPEPYPVQVSPGAPQGGAT